MRTSPQTFSILWLKKETDGWMSTGLIKQIEKKDQRTGNVRILVRSLPLSLFTESCQGWRDDVIWKRLMLWGTRNILMTSRGGRGQSYLEERNERRKWKTLIKSSTPDPELRTTKALNTVITIWISHSCLPGERSQEEGWPGEPQPGATRDSAADLTWDAPFPCC